MDVLDRLQRWFEENCNGEWEHGNGVRIETIDNPGWHVRILLEDTDLETLEFSEVDERFRGERDWVICQKKGPEFHGHGGAGNLKEILVIFLEWADASLS
ncbi:MAG: immunity 53 family protein [Planctomycetes bacterium]|nr:immunity 53 family protein [Planctomycetota bacterium]